MFHKGVNGTSDEKRLRMSAPGAPVTDKVNGLVTVEECLGGVRPSPGAARVESDGDAMKPGALRQLRFRRH